MVHVDMLCKFYLQSDLRGFFSSAGFLELPIHFKRFNSHRNLQSKIFFPYVLQVSSHASFSSHFWSISIRLAYTITTFVNINKLTKYIYDASEVRKCQEHWKSFLVNKDQTNISPFGYTDKKYSPAFLLSFVDPTIHVDSCVVQNWLPLRSAY